jgi:hypothetical protein
MGEGQENTIACPLMGVGWVLDFGKWGSKTRAESVMRSPKEEGLCRRETFNERAG